MSSRKRRVRAVVLRRLRRSARPVLENLEIRLTLSTGAGPSVMGPMPLLPHSAGSNDPSTFATPTFQVYHAPGSYPADEVPGPNGVLPGDNGNASPAGSGYTPEEIRAAYGIDDISFSGVVGDGAGQTIAIVDAYDNPNLVDSGSPNFATSDLGTYITAFPSVFGPNGLTGFTFTKVGQTGGAPPTATDPARNWEVEEALDVEMVHAIAPKANIILVEANSSSLDDLTAAESYAASAAPVVSNSWGSPEASGQTAFDAMFQVPNVTFLFSTGDSGAPGGYPAFSPNVVAVGGTALDISPVSGMTAETAWSTENLFGSQPVSIPGVPTGGGGGGTSQYEPEPSYQEGVQSTGKRTTPDVSSNADPATGVAIYDGFVGGWFQVGGTSEACPVWAAQVAIANQGRAQLGALPLTGYNETLPALYSLPYTDFHDVTVGTNKTISLLDQVGEKLGFGTYSAGFQARPGYDQTTGLGAPRSNLLVPDLAAYGLTDHLVVATQPPSSVAAGAGFGLTVMTADANGNIDSSFNGTVTLSLPSSSGTFAPVSATAVNGMAVFDGLSLGSTGAYTLEASATVGGLALTVDTSSFAVTAAASGSYYPATSDQSLRNAINTANASAFASNTIYLEAGTYTLTNSGLGQLVLQNTSATVANKTITIVGQGPGQTIITPSTSKGFNDRVFEVIGSAGHELTVVFQGLTIAGGHASNDGGLGVGAALGGGLLIKGGTVKLSNVNVSGNVAGGNVGAAGATGGKRQPGSNGSKGANGLGGGVYLASGQLRLMNAQINRNIAWGGWGGTGGQGGLGSGRGAAGGRGGSARGGGLYAASGSVRGTSNQFDSNAAFGGRGGSGGIGGTGTKGIGGAGGDGGAGGGASGGALFVAGGGVTLNASQFDKAWAAAGDGGWGGGPGLTKSVTSKVTQLFANISAGEAANGGTAIGAGVYLQGGALSLSRGSVRSEAGAPGAGGVNGSAAYVSVAVPGGGSPGTVIGGGMYLAAGQLTIAGLSVAHNQAAIGGGILNAAGAQITGSGLSLSNNNASSQGGGVYNSGLIETNGGQFIKNRAASGGGVYNVGRAGNSNLGVLGLSSASFVSNSASSGAGGAIANVSGQLHGGNLVVSQNRAKSQGGGIYSLQGSLTIQGASTIENNTVSATDGSGGGIYLGPGQALIAGAVVSGNSAGSGGGIANHGTLTFKHGGAPNGGQVVNNVAQAAGGGIANFGALTLQNVTILGNSAGDSGGGVVNNGTATLNGGSISSNSATFGGGVANSNQFAIQNATIDGNTAEFGGGALNSGTLALQNVAVQNNTVSGDGGGIDNTGTLSMSDGSKLIQNKAQNGGGLYNGSGAQANAAGLLVQGNTAQNGSGGGIYNDHGALAIAGETFTSNSAVATGSVGGNGGAVFLSGGKATITGGTSGMALIASNSAVRGGGVYLNSGTLSLTSVPIKSNTASGSGGGAYVNARGKLVLSSETVAQNTAGADGGGVACLGVLTAVDTIFTSDQAAGAGGALMVASGATATITTSTISEGAAASGAGIDNSGVLTINASTISGGTATNNGGGIANEATGALDLFNSTIAGNTGANGGGVFSQGLLQALNATIAENTATAAGGGGGLNATSGAAVLFNTIVASNSDLGLASNVAGTLAAASAHDLIGAGGSGGLVNGINGNLVGVADPGLGTLADNGGPTLTIALLAGSPAIDAGSNTFPGLSVPADDERGALRGGQAQSLNAGTIVDIGAYEASSSYLITSTADSPTNGGSLRAGLDWALQSTNDNPENLADPAPNTLFFDTQGVFSAAQTINLINGPLVLQSNAGQGVAIIGPGNGIVTINAQKLSRAIEVSSEQSATLQGLTIIGGLSSDGQGGGGVRNQGTLALVNMTISANSAPNGGGVASTGPLTITGGTFYSNSATSGDGGAVDSTGPLTINGTVFQNNSASRNGGGVASSTSSNGLVSITGATFDGNTAATSGGGLFVGAGTASITGGSFQDNSATSGDGGAVDLAKGGGSIVDASFQNNSAQGLGGAIASLGGDGGAGLALARLSLSGNTAGNGGALYNAGPASLTSSTFDDNTAIGGDGGGIRNIGTLTIDGTTFSNNVATGLEGGGIANDGTLTLTNSTLYGGAAPHGGGVSNVNGTAALTNVTIANNTATIGGGGVANSGTLTTINVTIASNSAGASGAGGGIDNRTGTATLYNTIVDLNTGNAPGADVAGDLAADSSNNLIGVANPGLASLADNGGPTLTIALLAGSPALDAGANSVVGQTVPTADQRGADRGPAGLNTGANVDIGAYEASSSFRVVASGDADNAGDLRTAVGWANASFNDNAANLAPNASAPNTIVINVPGHVTLAPALGPLVLSNTTTAEAIVNQSGGAFAIDGGGQVEDLNVAAAVTASLLDIELTGGSAATGGGINNAGTLALNGVLVDGNTATKGGGGAFNSGTLVLDAATVFSNNSSGRDGGAIDSTGAITINGATFLGNTAATSGGGLFVGAGAASITGGSFQNNSAVSGDGGAVDLAGNGSSSITGATFSHNSAPAGLGGALNNRGNLNALALTFNDNSASNGGAFANEQQAGLEASAFNDNTATGNGGGVNNTGTLTIDGSSFSNNASTNGRGGGIASGGTLTLTNSTLHGGSAPRGGALSNDAGTAALTSVTIANNSATLGGGAIDNSLGALTAVNVTIFANHIGMTGVAGGIDNSNGSAELYNTIVAGNATTGGSPSDVAGTLSVLSSNNLLGAGGSGGLVGGVQGNLVGIKTANLGLGALGDNGGPTLTVALLAGSPAIDAGGSAFSGVTVPNVDQRGAVRGAAGLHAGPAFDIGAYEASSSYLVSLTADSNAPSTLRSGVAWAGVSTNANPTNLAPATPAPNTVVFDSAGAFNSPQTIALSAGLGPLVLSNATTSVAIDGTTSGGLTISGGGATGLLQVTAGTSASLDGLTFANGSARAGGAIQNLGTLKVAYATFQYNSAASGGALDNQGTLGLSNSTFNDNTSPGQGGAILNEPNGVLTLTNVTLAANSAQQGGGVYNLGGLTASCVTIAGNTVSKAGSGGGLNNVGSGSAVLTNSIVSTNTDAGGGSDDVAGDLAPDSANNLIAVADPGLGALSSNGGPTETMPLLTGSPALGAGNASLSGTPSTDQRGVLRGADLAPPAIDIGAFESGAAYLVTSPADSLVPGTLRSAIGWANANSSPTPFLIRFDTNGAFRSPQSIVLGLGTLALTNTTTPIDIDGPGANIVTISGGGAFGAFSIASGTTAEFSNLTIADGAAAGAGGAIDNAGNLTVQNVLFSNDAAASGSGGALSNTGTLTVTGGTFENNSAAYYGGAVFNNGGTASVVGSTFRNNSAQYGQGGSINNLRGTLAISGSTFQGGTAFQGGAVFNRSGTATIDTTTLGGGYAYQGGAVFNDGTATAPGTTTITNSTLTDNSAFQGGAAANNYNGVMTITNSTLANNTSYQYGGAINSVASLALVCDTIAYNNVVAGGIAGGLDASVGDAVLYNTIIELNTVGTGDSALPSDIVGSLDTSSAYNMVGGGLINGVNHNIVGPTYAGLAAALADNGGPTQTIALLAGSPALGAGSATIPGVVVPNTDQTGQPRPANKFDIGAYQSALTAPTGGGNGSGSGSGGSGATVTNSAAAPRALVAGTSLLSTSAAASPPAAEAAAPLVVTGPAPFRGRHLHARHQQRRRRAARAARPKTHGARHNLAHPARHHLVALAMRHHRPA